ncbi:MAG: hypothetical protein R3B90_00905 [Planctomycetaceae bacterium]|jgi:hypothetical protein
MTPAASPHPVAAGKLDSSIQRLRHALEEYREELSESEAAFDRWQQQWHDRQQEIDGHLRVIQGRLGPQIEPGGPALSLVRPDE